MHGSELIGGLIRVWENAAGFRRDMHDFEDRLHDFENCCKLSTVTASFRLLLQDADYCYMISDVYGSPSRKGRQRQRYRKTHTHTCTHLQRGRLHEAPFGTVRSI